MTEKARSSIQGSFTLERTYPATPARVYDAFATEAGKALWFGGPPDEMTMVERSFDFRVGGEEHARGRWIKTGVVSDFRARYYDIVRQQRIVYAYEMHLDDVKISVSLATVEIRPEGAGTKLTVTEHGVFLDGYDDNGSRKHGTGYLLDRIGATLTEKI